MPLCPPTTSVTTTLPDIPRYWYIPGYTVRVFAHTGICPSIIFTVQFTPFSSTTTTSDGDGTYECELTSSCMHMDSPCTARHRKESPTSSSRNFLSAHEKVMKFLERQRERERDLGGVEKVVGRSISKYLPLRVLTI